MIVLDYLLISNSPDDGGVLAGTFTPAEGNAASKLTLQFANGEIVVDGDEAAMLFDHYVQTGKRIGPAQYVTISGDAVRTLAEFFERLGAGYFDAMSERRIMADRCRTIIKTLQSRSLRS